MIKAAVIGFYRSGATIDEIHEVTGLSRYDITQIIHEHLKSNNELSADIN